MDDTVNVGVGLEHLVEAILLGDIELDELGLLAADELNTLKGLRRGVVQVVSNDDLVASLEQGQGGERANVARATAGESAFQLNQTHQMGDQLDVPSNKNRTSRHD